MTSIHFIRHGEVENPRDVRYGRLTGFHLSAEGRRQAETLAHALCAVPFAAIFTSPMERAQQTASIVALAHPHLPLRVDERLNEVELSPRLEGVTRAVPHTYNDPSSGETPKAIVERMLAFCSHVVEKFPDGVVAAVSHGDPIGLLYHYLMVGSFSPQKYLYPPYAGSWEFCFHGQVCEAVIGLHYSTSGAVRR